MITITYDTVKSHITSDDALERKAVYTLLDHHLSFFKNGYFFSPQYEMGQWDGKQHFFSVVTGKVYSGFVTRCLQILHKEGVEYELVGYPTPIGDSDDISPITLPDGLELFEHQAYAARRALKFSRGVVQVAPNGGKTEIAAAIIYLANYLPTCYYVPRATLVNQTALRLEKRLGVSVGRIGAGFNQPNENGITVAMTHSTSQRLKAWGKAKVAERRMIDIKYVTNADIVIGDECHLASDARYQESIEKCPARIRVLMSGTPFRKDPVERGFVQAYGGPLLAKVSNDELIEKGISAKPNVLYLEPKIPILTRAKYSLMDYRDALQNCEERNKTIAAIARAFLLNGEQVIIMVARVEHAKQIHRWIPEATLTHGSASNRGVTEKKIRLGEVFCCIATAIFDTGLDTPNIGAIVYASGGPDEIRLGQTLGRILRQNANKTKSPWLIDFLDMYHKILAKHSRTRLKFFKQHKNFNLTEDLSMLPSGVYNRFMQETGRN